MSKATNIFDCKSLDSFIKSIVYALPFTGYSESRFFICELAGVRFLTKLCFYRKSVPEIYGRVDKKLTPQTAAEIEILSVLKDEVIEQGLTPCILQMIYHKTCGNILKLIPKQKDCFNRMLQYTDPIHDESPEDTFCRMADLIKNGFAENKCSFLVLEKCDMSLDEFIRKSVNTPVSQAVFKSLLFMKIHSMYAITKKFPKFRHNDLHTHNVLLKFDPKYTFKASDPKFLVFIVEGREYFVPYFGIIPKLIDFGFAEIPERGIVSNIKADKWMMYWRQDNDLLTLFHYIYLIAWESGGDKLAYIDNLLSSIEPNRTYVHYYAEYIRKIASKIPDYQSMVTNKVFDEYLSSVPEEQIYAEYGRE